MYHYYIYAALSGLVATAGAYAVVDADVLGLADKAMKKAAAVGELNAQGLEHAARTAFFIDHGRMPRADDELYERGYLERVEVPEALKE